MSDSLPATGYADYRRTDDATIDTLVDVANVASTPNPTYGRFFIGQTPSLEINFSCDLQNHDLDIAFFSQQVGGADFALTRYTAIANSTLRMRVPAYGPWVLLQVLPKTATNNGTHNLTVLTSRRIAGSSMPMFNTALFHRLAVSIGAGVIITEDITIPYTGWAMYTQSTNAVAWNVLIETRDRDNSRVGQCFGVTSDDAGRRLTKLLYIPPLILKHRVKNEDGAAKVFDTSIVPVFL